MDLKRLFICLFWIFCLIPLSAQIKTFQGTVYGSDNKPLSGVRVTAKGSGTYTLTDASGSYQIEVPDTVFTLEFDHPEMKSSSASIGMSPVIDVYMVDSDSEVMAEISLEDLMNIEITVASTKAEDILSTVSTVAVIDNNTIEKYHFETITEALQSVAGIDIVRTYLKRNLPTARGILQDHYANKVLIMINNVPVWHAVTGEGSLDRINIYDVERIEVLKGPASVLYGTNAYSGAINIVLKKNAPNTSSSYFKVGSHGLLGGGSQLLLNKEGRNLFLSANIEEADGSDYTYHDEQDSINILKEYLNTRNITGLLEDKHVRLLVNYYEAEESYMGVTPSFSAGAGHPHELKGLVAGMKVNYELLKDLMLNYSFQYDWNHRDLSRTGNDNTRARIDGYRVDNLISLSYPVTKKIHLEMGGNWEFRQSNYYENYNVPSDTTLTDNNMSGISLNAYSAFGQLNYFSDKLNVTVGGRFSHNELFKNNFSSRATLVYKFNQSNSMKLIFGESFRAPSLFEQNFTTTTFTVVGNPDLVPETSSSVELAYLKRFDKLFLQMTTYYAWYEGKIFRHLDFYPPAGDSVNIYANGETFSALGVEAEIKYINPQWVNGFLNMNYIAGNKGDQIGDHYNFKYVPKFYLTSGLSRSFNKIRLSLVLNLKSGAEGPQAAISPMYKIDLNLGYKHLLAGKVIRHTISVKNMTNSNYYVPEYVRLRNVNEVPLGYGRSLLYTIHVDL